MNTQDIIAAANTARAQRISAEQSDLRGWSDISAGRRFIRALETLSFWADSPNSVTASATGNHCWGYLASEILDSAFADTYPDADLDAAYIEQVSPDTYCLIMK